MNVRFFKQLSGFFLEHGIKTVSGLATTLIIINHLKPSDYGVLSLALTSFAVLSAVASLGLDSILLRKLIEYGRSIIVSESVVLRIIVSLLISLFVIIFAFYFDNTWLWLLSVLVVSLFFDSFLGFRELAFSNKKYSLIITANSVASISQFASALFLVQFQLPIYWFVIPFVLNRVLFISSILYFEQPSKPVFPQGLSVNFGLLREAVPLLVAAIAGLAYAAQDQWMIAYYMTDEDVGVYAAAIKLVLMLIVVPTIITNILYHKIIGLRRTAGFDEYLHSLYSLLFYCGLIIYLIISVLSESLVELIFPDEYGESAYILSVYSIILLVAFFQSLNNKLLILNEQQHLIMYRVVLSLCVNFALNLFLIPRYQLTGAAFATVISELFIIISYGFTKATRNLFWLQLKALNPMNCFLMLRLNLNL